MFKKTIKNIPSKINSINDPENDIPLNELIPRILSHLNLSLEFQILQIMILKMIFL